MSVRTTGLWEAAQKEAICEFAKKITTGCVEAMGQAQKVADFLTGHNKNNDADAVESVLNALFTYAGQQVESVKETVTDIAMREKTIEEEKGDQTGWADEVLTIVNALEIPVWKPVDYVVGGPQVTEDLLADIQASFKPLRDSLQVVINDSKAAVEEVSESQASFTDALTEIHNAMQKVFVEAIEMLNGATKDFRALIDDSKSISNKLRGYASDKASEGSAKANATAQSVKKDVNAAVSDMV